MSKEEMNHAIDVLRDSQDYKMGRAMTVEAVEALEEALATQEHDCTRSHPHEEMSKECELRTEIARLTNKLANIKQEQGSTTCDKPVAWELGAEVYWGDSPEMSDYVRKNGTPLYTTPQQRKPLTYKQIRDLWASENGLEDCDLCQIDDFIAAVQFIEAAYGIKE